MRFATLRTNLPGHHEISVVTLTGAAGGELANVNRWRDQLGLPHLDEQALASQRISMKSPAGTVSVFDFASEGPKPSRTVAALISTPDGNTWFFKLTGDVQPVGKAKPGFLHLLETLSLD